MRGHRRGEGGFTLVELLVVIAVLGVLAGIVIVNVTSFANTGHATACETDVKTVQLAVDSYLYDNQVPALTTGTMDGGDWNLLVPAYVHTTPASCVSFTLTAIPGAGGYAVTSP